MSHSTRPISGPTTYVHFGGYGSEGNGPLTTWNSRTSVERVLGPGPTFAFARWEKDGKTIADKVNSVELNLTADTRLCAQGEEKAGPGAKPKP